MDETRKENLDKIRALGDQVKSGSDNTYVIEVDYEAVRGVQYTGTVVAKRPNMADYMKMGVRKGQIIKKHLGDEDLPLAYIDESIKYLAQILSALEVVILKRPEWLLKPEECADFDVLEHIYRRYELWLSNFRDDVPADESGASE